MSKYDEVYDSYSCSGCKHKIGMFFRETEFSKCRKRRTYCSIAYRIGCWEPKSKYFTEDGKLKNRNIFFVASKLIATTFESTEEVKEND